MKRAMFFSTTTVILAVISTLIITSVAFAGGWHKVGTKEGNTGGIQSPTDPNVTDIGKWDTDTGLWTSESEGVTARVPHLNLQTSTNNCRTCHAVHNADNIGKALGDDPEINGTGNSFKLLRNESRETECNFCHGPNGALSDPIKKPYAEMISGGVPIPAKGEHTLGAKVIPDSTVDPNSNSIAADGLSCGNCHSVHGGWTLNNVPAAGLLSTRILKRDPANNGNDSNMNNDPSFGDGAADGVKNVQWQGNGNKPIDTPTSDTQLEEKQIMASFCGDCHNKNVNWSTGGSGVAGQLTSLQGVSEGTRPNKFAHPIGKLDGLIDIYGKLQSVEPTVATPRLSCDNCHASRGQSPSKFPHQSVGHKLMDNSYNDTSAPLDTTDYKSAWDSGTDSYTGDPSRPLPKLDSRLCRGCHSFIGQASNPDSF